MYVNPFIMGIFSTIVVELVLLIGYAFVITNRGNRR